MLASDQIASVEIDWMAGNLAIPMPTFSNVTTCGQAFEWFRDNRDQVAAAVVDDQQHVVGIANRLRFLARYAQPYVPELYAKKPIGKLSNAAPLIVDEKIPLGDLSKMLTFDWPDALRECFIVTRENRYLGVGTSEALVKAKMSLLLSRENQLNIALAEAYEANKAKGNFLALMSHELRTPLNAIIGFSEVLATELFGPHTVPRYREYSSDIHFAGKHLLALINDILDLSKLEAGKLNLHAEILDLREVYAACIKLVAERAREQHVEIRINILPDMPQLNADKLRVKQILLNLLSNAVKFTPSGGRVELAANVLDGRIVLCVSDTGIGMTAEQIPLALEPFRQIDSPLSRTAEGTGLGLSLVKALAEQHEATLTIESEANRGTHVAVLFPAARTHWGTRSAVA